MKLNEPIDITKRYHDRSFIRCGTNQIPDVVDKVVKSAVAKGYDMSDIQVLAPMYKGNAGIKRLNQVLQSILNPKQQDDREIEFGEAVFRKGDKVLQLVNRPNDNIFNGDIGIIVGIFWAKENALNKDVLVVDFEGNEITFTKDGKKHTGKYEYNGKKTLKYPKGNRGVRFMFKLHLLNKI